MSKAWKNTTNAMVTLIIAGFVTFIVNIIMMRGMALGGMAVIGLGLPIFYLITIMLKKQKAFSLAIFVLSIIGVIGTVSSLISYIGMWGFLNEIYSLMPLLMVLCIIVLVGDICLLVSINKLRKES